MIVWIFDTDDSPIYSSDGGFAPWSSIRSSTVPDAEPGRFGSSTPVVLVVPEGVDNKDRPAFWGAGEYHFWKGKIIYWYKGYNCIEKGRQQNNVDRRQKIYQELLAYQTSHLHSFELVSTFQH